MEVDDSDPCPSRDFGMALSKTLRAHGFEHLHSGVASSAPPNIRQEPTINLFLCKKPIVAVSCANAAGSLSLRLIRNLVRQPSFT
jgi:hypothetical protein